MFKVSAFNFMFYVNISGRSITAARCVCDAYHEMLHSNETNMKKLLKFYAEILTSKGDRQTDRQTGRHTHTEQHYEYLDTKRTS